MGRDHAVGAEPRHSALALKRTRHAQVEGEPVSAGNRFPKSLMVQQKTARTGLQFAA